MFSYIFKYALKFLCLQCIICVERVDRNMKVFIITLGCKVNQYESEVMLELFLNSGFEKANKTEDADVIIINSCTVTAASDQKVRQMINRTRGKNNNSIIVLTGCMPQAFPEIANTLDNIDIILGNSNRSDVLDSVISFMSNHQRIVDIKPHGRKDSFEEMSVTTFHGRTRAFIKIEDGCNRFCSYCIIPYARGGVRSKSLKDLEEEIIRLSEAGYTEVVLVGINLSAYGQDIGLHLCDAVETACKVEKIKRVRLGSLEPEKMDYGVLERLSLQEKLCPQFHLSLQSGCDDTLKRMNRHYNTYEYYEIVSNIRRLFKNPAITTDVMVGFPRESDEEFNQSLEFVKKVGFSKVHVFSYSRRPGTKADLEKDQVLNSVKTIRSKEMIKTTDEIRLNFLDSQVGTIQPVLFENLRDDSCYEGYTPNYTPVLVKSENDISGKILNVLIESVNEGFCCGKIL